MTRTKIIWRRRLAILFCAILIFSSILPPAAFADTSVISSAPMTSYFQTYTSTGTWVDLQTPAHWITATGEVAYCLQTSKDNPYNAGYYTVEGYDYYSDYVLTGLQAILDHGYPSTTAGFTDEEARYATANAIRFWLAENYCDGVPQYLNLNVNGDWIQGKYGYEDLYQWAIYLVYYARYQVTNPVEGGTLEFSSDTITLTEDASGQYFTGDVYLTKNISNDYSLMDNVPDGQLSVTGYTGTQSETLSLSLPASLAEQSYTLCAYGMDDAPSAKLFFWAPASANNQRIMTYVLDSTTSVFVRGFLTINTPTLAERTGSIRITKTDESGTPLSGVSFSLFDSNQALITSGVTDGSGQVTFSGLALGDYFYQETDTLPGYVLDSAMHAVTVSGDQVVEISVTNSQASGSIVVMKTDADTGAALAGVHFALLDSTTLVVADGYTEADGTLLLSGIPLGSYTLRESETVSGYVLDPTPIPVEITANGQTVTVNATNAPAKGGIAITKTEADTGNVIAGVHFVLYDAGSNPVTEGDTDGEGKLSFSALPLGTYSLVETSAPSGYVPDSTPRTVTISEHGQTVEISVTNGATSAGILVVKTDAETGAPLSGIHFVLTDSSGATVGGGGTDEAGELRFSGLPLGTYTLTETETRNGYVLDSTPITVTLDANGQTVTQNISNTPARGAVSVLKTDAETGAPIAGVHFELRDEAGALCAEGDTSVDGTLTLPDIPLGSYTLQETTTPSGYVPDRTRRPVNKTGYAIYGSKWLDKSKKNSVIYTSVTGSETLPYGTITVKEIEAPKGYVLDDSVHTFTVSDVGAPITKNVTDMRRPGTLIVKKQNASGSPLEGAAFLLEYSTDDGATWKPVFYRAGNEVARGACTTAGLNGGELTTGADGTATFTGLRADGLILYRLTETIAPPGMSLLDKPILVGTLPAESDNIQAEDSEVFDSKAFHYTLEITATDSFQYRLPETGGDDGLRVLPFAMMLMALPGIIIFDTKTIKKRRLSE